jgi:carboxymethylenebutenolidase
MSNSSTIQLNVADGTTMQAYASPPSAKPNGAGILVLQEAFGVNRHIRNVADRFAAQGYHALAPELFHRSAPPGWEGNYNNFPSVMPHIRAMTIPGLEADLRAAFHWLTDAAGCAPVHAVGYCMGGRCAYIANSILPLGRAVSYYGGGITGELLDRAKQMNAPILLFWGGKDKHIGPEQRRALFDALAAAKKSYINVEFSDADHGFNCDERPSFHEAASRQAWALTFEFLKA